MSRDIVEDSAERENMLLLDPRVPVFRLYERHVCDSAHFEAPENIDLVSRGAPLQLNVVLNLNRAGTVLIEDLLKDALNYKFVGEPCIGAHI